MSAVLEQDHRVEERALEPHPFRFTVDDYYRMGEAGMFGPEQRVELIEGEIIEMAPIGASHADWVDRLNLILARGVPDGVRVRVQGPVRLSLHSEPQPDLALLRPRAQPYSEAHPSGPDTLLVIEVSDTSLRYDREVKVPLYARRGVPEVWLLDIRARRLDIYRGPSDEGYRLHLRPALDETLVPAALPDLKIDLAGLLGPGDAA
jgi:Uma2 family endonuclease